MKKAEKTSLSALVDDLDALKSGPPDAGEFANILDELEAQIYVIDPDSLHYDFINKTALKTVGWAGVDYTNLTPADDDPYFNADQFRHMTARLLNGEQKEVKFYRSLHDMPETEVRIRLTRTSQGIPKLLVVVRPPPSLADHRAMIAPVTELSPIATTVVRGDTGKILYANQKFRHKFSLPYTSLEGQNISDVFEHLNPVELRQISTLLKQSAAGNVSFEVTTSDGQHFELKISHVVLFAGRSDLAIIFFFIQPARASASVTLFSVIPPAPITALLAWKRSRNVVVSWPNTAFSVSLYVPGHRITWKPVTPPRLWATGRQLVSTVSSSGREASARANW